jgi:hypothetical protein
MPTRITITPAPKHALTICTRGTREAWGRLPGGSRMASTITDTVPVEGKSSGILAQNLTSEKVLKYSYALTFSQVGKSES